MKNVTPIKSIVLTFTLILFSVTVSYAALSGTYTIDASAAASATNYKSFTSSVSDLLYGTRTDGGQVNGPGVSGPVIFQIAAGTYNEQVVLNNVAGVSAVNTITFDGGAGNAATRIVQFNGSINPVNYAVFTLYSTSYIRIRNITINQTAKSNGWGILLFSTQGGTPFSHDNSIENCIVNMSEGSTTNINLYGIIAGGSQTLASTTSGRFTNILIDGCKVNNGYYGISMYTFNTSSLGNIVSNNTVTNPFLRGIYFNGGTNPVKIRNNKITTNTTSTSNRGIDIIGVSPDSTDNLEISGNIVPSFGAVGIAVGSNAATATQRIRIVNNFVGGNINSAFSSVAKGLACNSGYADIWFNSVNMNIPLTNATSTGAFFANESPRVEYDIRNNIFAVTDASSQGLPFNYNSGGVLTNFNSFDNNLFYNAAGTDEANIGGTVYTAVTLIGAGGFNSLSSVANPGFDNNATTNYLHLSSPNGQGVSIPAVTQDIDGDVRNNPPDIGADETAKAGCQAAAGTVTAQRDTICENTPAMLTVTGHVGASLQWQQSITVSGGFTNITAATEEDYTASLTQTSWFRVVAVDGNCSDTSQPVKVVVKPSPAANFTFLVSELNVSFDASGSSGDITNFEWDFGDSTGNEGSGLMKPGHAYAVAGNYYVCLTVTNGSNCSYTVCNDVSLITGITVTGDNSGLKIFPSPFDDYFFISLSTAPAELAIMDITGRVVFENTFENGSHTIQIDAAHLPDGIYFMKIRSSEQTYIQKIIKD